MADSSRTVLCNLCEEWIITQGGFYKLGEAFLALPCGHAWHKEDKGRFRDQSSTVWNVHFLKEEPHLEPEGADPPILHRCCSRILIEHGPQIDAKKLPLRFSCPVCEIAWTIHEELRYGVLIRLYTDESGTAFKRTPEEIFPPYLELVSRSALVS